MNVIDAEAQNPGFFRKLYLGWLEIAARFGEVQTMIIVSLVYSFVVGPTAVVIAVVMVVITPLRAGCSTPG